MCNVCCKEFRGWCRSFTRTETCLAILEGALLIILVGFLVFLILHFVACSNQSVIDEIYSSTTTEALHTPAPLLDQQSPESTLEPTTLPADIECTWTPSAKTSPQTRYYDLDTDHIYKIIHTVENSSSTAKSDPNAFATDLTLDYINEPYESSEQSDGEEAEDIYKNYVLALVKLKPPTDVTFGCILTVVSKFWTVTAASCVESIEEVDSLDNFIMMEDYGSVRHGRMHAVSDIRIHPLYQGVNRSYDLVALKSEDRLMKTTGTVIKLPILLDYFLITIGERFIILGYGAFRSIDRGPRGRALRKVTVYIVPGTQCGGGAEGEGAGALRHLRPAGGVPHAACGAGAVCAGVARARGAPCNYCAGSPLVRGGALYGVMARGAQCGAHCEPQLYVNVAAARDWLDAVLADRI